MEEFMLIRPTGEYAAQLMEYRQEFLDAGDSMDGCGPLRRYENPEEYIQLCRDYENPATVPSHLVLATQLLYIRKCDNKLVGMLQIRHCFNDYLEKYAGHIGDGIRPSERGKGYATEMIRLALFECRKLGIHKVLMVCDKSNTASRKSIIKNGGILENEFLDDEGEVHQRFWIELEN